MGTGLGESKGESKGALEYLSRSKLVQIFIVVTGGYVVGKAIKGTMSSRPANFTLSDRGTHYQQEEWRL